jgi:EF hand
MKPIQRISTFSMVCLLVLAGGSAHAQAAPTARTPNPERMEKARNELQKRFEAADTNKDGKLSAQEARAGMPMVSKNFDTIDTAHTGTISLSDIETFIVSRKGSHKAAN